MSGKSEVKRVDIKDFGIFDIKYNYLHRGINPRIVTFHKDRFKSIQFNTHYNELDTDYQEGYDYNGKEIKARLV